MMHWACVSPSFSLGWKKKQKDHRLGSNLAKNDSISLNKSKLALRAQTGICLAAPLHHFLTPLAPRPDAELTACCVKTGVDSCDAGSGSGMTVLFQALRYNDAIIRIC